MGVPAHAVAIPVERPVGVPQTGAGSGPGTAAQPSAALGRTSALALLAALDQPTGSDADRRAAPPAPTGLSVGAVAVMAAAQELRASVDAASDSPAGMAPTAEATEDLEPVVRATSNGDPHRATSSQGAVPTPAAATPDPSSDPCTSVRTLVDERCEVAAAARDQAKNALDVLREAQRQYDVLRERVDTAQAQADPRLVAAAKEALHREFRSATAAAAGAEATEQAAREWLDRVNELNGRTRAAVREIERGNEELRAAAPRLERLAVEADASRIAAESADIACREAREALAHCEESIAAASRAPVTDEPPAVPAWPASVGQAEPQHPATLDVGGPTTDPQELSVIVRVLRGDRAARDRLVATVAKGDAASTGEWQIRVAQLVDAIVARAIEDGFLDLPEDAPFWNLFTARERRDVVAALSALGYRYDGLGGFADGRVPPPRDLSLAVGYAGLDRMRIRTWPAEDELPQLYTRATVAADEWLAAEGGDLSLGLMVDALGARATDLADVWNAWGRLRPAMLATG
jgi:hypothetical protein